MDIRARFDAARARVEQSQRSGAASIDIVRAHTSDVDEIVRETYHRGLAAADAKEAGIALVALGGYGRAELAPNSDLDLLLLCRGQSSTEIAEINREVMYPLWDSGREIGARVRDPRDVSRSLDQIDEACAALDARLIAGDRGLFADVQGAIGMRLERGRSAFMSGLAEATGDRHRRYGDAGHLLEPNIRDAAGGLRDVHTLLWASKVLPGADGLDGLVESGRLSGYDAKLVSDAFSFILRLRIELHLATNRHQDQLYLTDQDVIAGRLGYATAAGRPAGDGLMQELFTHTRHLGAVVSAFWTRSRHGLARRRWRRVSSINVGDGCVVHDGQLDVVATTNVNQDPAGWLRVFRRSVLSDVPVGRASMTRLAEELDGSATLEWSGEAREVFLDVLAAGTAAVPALESMALSGLMSALIPEWDAIRSLPQRDLYHRYTVDRHLLAAVAELASSRSADAPDAKDAWSRVGDGDPLYLAALLHDIGKGRQGDHSAIGAEIATSVAGRMGITTSQISDVAFLVREHLTLAETAVRRDLNDAATVQDVARRVGDERRLAMLYLLTRADSLATAAEAWSSFRASLVRELYARTRDHLAGAPSVSASVSERFEELASELGLSREDAIRLLSPMPESWLAGLEVEAARRQVALLREELSPGEVRTAVYSTDEADEFIVVAPDRPGLFSTVAGVLALRAVDVHDAEIYTRADGVALEVFRVRGTHGPLPPERWARLHEDIAAAVDGRINLDDALGQKATQTRRRGGRHRSSRAARVVIDNHASTTHTIVEVHAEDRIGLLRTITKALADCGCDLAVAKVATYGIEVVDVFYVSDLSGRKIDDPSQVALIEERLMSALSSDA